jgi:hypothetical protein
MIAPHDNEVAWVGPWRIDRGATEDPEAFKQRVQRTAAALGDLAVFAGQKVTSEPEPGIPVTGRFVPCWRSSLPPF